MNQPKKSAGKGDKPRNCHSLKFKENFSQINWSGGKLQLSIRDKVFLYPELLKELLARLLGVKELSPEECFVSDESVVKDFLSKKEDLQALGGLEKKYNLKKIKMGDFLWKITEKMKDAGSNKKSQSK